MALMVMPGLVPAAFSANDETPTGARLQLGSSELPPKSTTHYSFYQVKGKSAQEVYNAIMSRGPMVNGVKAYASTSATSSHEGKLLPGQQCSVIDYRITIDFTILLPRLANEKALKSTTRKRWRSFSAFLKSHEEKHRAIWLECAQELEDQVRALRADNCEEIDREAARLWDQVHAQCNLRHDVFDSAEQKRLAVHPFVSQVTRQSRAASNSTDGKALKKKSRAAAAVN
jgi:predicted secreted Zn-dependent protease